MPGGILSPWSGALNGRHIAIDGKTRRGSHDRFADQRPPHVVRALVAAALSATAV